MTAKPIVVDHENQLIELAALNPAVGCGGEPAGAAGHHLPGANAGRLPCRPGWVAPAFAKLEALLRQAAERRSGSEARSSVGRAGRIPPLTSGGCNKFRAADDRGVRARAVQDPWYTTGNQSRAPAPTPRGGWNPKPRVASLCGLRRPLSRRPAARGGTLDAEAGVRRSPR
jgi:hypothetical protein